MKKCLFLFLFVFVAQFALAQGAADAAQALGNPFKKGGFAGALQNMKAQKTEKTDWLKKLERASREAEEKAKKHNILKESPAPKLGIFTGEGNVSPVAMREFFLSGPEEGVPYVGTFGASTCIIVVLVGKKDGRVIQTGLAHVDIFCEIEESFSFFSPVLKEADEVEVYLLSSMGYERTALRVWNFLTNLNTQQKKISYFVNLQGPSGVVVNVKTGEVYAECKVEWLDVSKEELHLLSQQAGAKSQTPSALLPSKKMEEVYLRRQERY